MGIQPIERELHRTPIGADRIPLVELHQILATGDPAQLTRNFAIRRSIIEGKSFRYNVTTIEEALADNSEFVMAFNSHPDMSPDNRRNFSASWRTTLLREDVIRSANVYFQALGLEIPDPTGNERLMELRSYRGGYVALEAGILITIFGSDYKIPGKDRWLAACTSFFKETGKAEAQEAFERGLQIVLSDTNQTWRPPDHHPSDYPE